ncbi:VPA1269 family protein [Agrobacterium radiobacter]|uniref:VPA1269 family protein n=1 Tax=Agrobacterium TaxID=357 RepID=UPI0013E99F8C|nr:VPA1269 family protein [Agrobacterium sp. CFBP2214]
MNLTTRHIGQSGNVVLDGNITEALSILKAYPKNKPLTDEICDKIDLVINSDVCLSPSFFYEKDKRPSKLVVLEMVKQTELGAQMWDALHEAGAFAFMERVTKQSQRNYASEIARIIAVFALCTIGEENFAAFPLQAIHAVVDFFRSDNGTRWRGELWGAGEIGFQCMREVVLGLAKIRSDPALAAKTGQDREAEGPHRHTRRVWTLMCNSNDQLDRELTRRYADYDQQATDGPKSRQQMVLDVRAYFESIGVDGPLSEILQEKDRKPSFIDFLIERTGKVTPYIKAHAARAQRFLEFTIGQLEEEHQGVVFHSLVKQRDVALLKNEVEAGPPKRRTTASRPLPGKLHAIAKAILDEGETGWPGQSGYFHEFVEVDGKRQKIYCPVIPTLLRTAMDLPLRMGQLRRLDSGEGDLEMFNGDTMTWEPNTSPLAGYWEIEEGRGR